MAGGGSLLCLMLGAAPVPRPASAPKLPPFSFEECVALLDDDPSDVSDYIAAHNTTGSDRAVRHCEALAEVMSGDVTTGATHLDELVQSRSTDPDEATPEERADVAADAARAWFTAGDDNNAEASASLGLTLAPDSIALHLLRDRALLRLGQSQEALTDLSSLGNNPLMAPEIHLLRATAERQTGHLAAAATDIEAALKATPDDPAALLERGIIRQQMRNSDGAREDWQRVIADAPDSHEADLARQDLDVMASDPDVPPPSPADTAAATPHP